MSFKRIEKEAKKVLVLNYEFPPIGGGAATATFNMLRVLARKKDIKINLVTSSEGSFKQEDFADNVKIHYLDIGKNGDIHSQSNKDLLIFFWKAFWYCLKLKKEEKFDLTHAFFGIPCGFIAMFLGIPYIVSLRGSDVPFYSEKYHWLDILFFSWLSKIVWARAKNVVANSQGLKELALKTKPNQEIEVIYNGVDTERFFPKEKKNDEFVVISTSRLIKRKGIDLLLEAFISFSKEHNNVKLVIAGDGELNETLKGLVDKNKLTDKVSFLGAVDREEIPGIYQKGDVFVLPSLNEGMSNSLLEAMASGLAIVATDTGGTRELVDERNGIIISPKSVWEIEKALEKLNNNRNLLKSLKKESRSRALKMRWEEMAGDYYEMYFKK
ncbi:glycosyltransferase family 4 protein [bacterium]|nr:glycosyltransferase family 4 protein [bacterium]MBT4598351.1 glycosyltransferase family 4 protein [bacterium]